MAQQEQTASNRTSQVIEAPRSAAIANLGVKTTRDLARVLSAQGSDVLTGRLSPSVNNSACAAWRGLIRAVEVQQKYGIPVDQSGARVLTLAE